MSEFNLSDKICKKPEGLTCACGKCELTNIRTRDVKEFIQRLKEEVGNPVLLTKSMRNLKFNEIIDEIAGEKLI